MSNQYYTFEPFMGGNPNLRTSYYDSTQLINNSRLLGPQGYADAIAFWYRPDPSDLMFERINASNASPGMVVPGEHVKHRRTRSGCYTCRSRRVKCDEKRPICARCKKGNRECVYPEPSTGSKSGSRPRPSDQQRANRQGSHSSSDDGEERKQLETIEDVEEEEDIQDKPVSEPKPSISSTSSSSSSKAIPGSVKKKGSTQSLSRKRAARQHSESSSAKDVTSPLTEVSTASFSGTHTPASSLRTIRSTSTLRSPTHPSPSSRWSHLNHDLQHYLQYHQDHISFFHYFFKMDPADFIHTDLVDLAISYEPLLYAIVGFAAYHSTVQQPNGKLSTFLKYYSLSLSSLRKTLETGRPPSEATIMTILTLATFEEYLGDWVNLIGHHRAANHLVMELFTPETIMNTDVSRQIFFWCSRFDVIAGLMGGNQTSFTREWYIACDDWYVLQEEKDPFDLQAKLGSVTASIRMAGFEMAELLSRLPQGKISMEDFMNQYQAIGERIDDVRLRIQSLNDGAHTVMEFPNKVPLNPTVDIVDPYTPGGLFAGPLFVLNFSWIDWFAVRLMYLYQLSIITQQPLPHDLAGLAYEQCRIFEAIEKWPDSPPGATIGAHASLGIASVFLQKDPRSTMWCRRKLAHVEGQGYIYPPTFRTKMAELWHLPEINQWWLPNNEQFHPILRAIRGFSAERASQPSDEGAEGLRDMKAIFSRLNIEDSSFQDSSSGGSSGTIGPSGHSPAIGSHFSTPFGSGSEERATTVFSDDGSNVAFGTPVGHSRSSSPHFFR